MVHVLFLVVCIQPNQHCIVATKVYPSDIACNHALPEEVAVHRRKGFHAQAVCMEGEDRAL